MKRTLNKKLILGMTVSGIFLALAVRNADLHEVARAFGAADWIYLVPSIAANFIGLWVRAVRWGLFLQPIRRIRMRDLFPSTVIGFMANNLFPARLGEVLRALVLARRVRIGRSAVFATIVLERLFDGAVVLGLLLLSVRLLGATLPAWLRNAGAGLAVGLVLLFGILSALKGRTRDTLRMAGFLLKPLPDRIRGRALGILGAFAEGLRGMHNVRSIALASFQSLGLWIFPALSIHFALLASGIRLPVFASFFLMGVLGIGVAVPSAPGFVGTVQFMSVLGLEFFGVSRGQALGYSFIYHLSQYIPVTGLGLFFFLREGLSFSMLKGERGWTRGDPDRGNPPPP